MSELKLDIDQALRFLDMLDPGGRHTIASEAPFGRNGDPLWEGGATSEAHQRKYLIEDITERQARGSNVYYGVNRPCPITEQQGARGKCNVEDIIAIRALAFDVDFTTKRTLETSDSFLRFVDSALIGVFRPSLVIDTGGGFQLIYLLKEFIAVQRYRPATTEAEIEENDQIDINCKAITELAQEIEHWLRPQVSSLPIKVDAMSNIDRVMRLPGTVNYPKAEKIAKGQVPAFAHIAVDYQIKCDIFALRHAVPRISVAPPQSARRDRRNTPPPNPHWPPYRKATVCCEFLRDHGLADTNEFYTLNVMLPLLGAAQDGELTLDEAEECFVTAISGGARYGTPGRGPRYFQRQWRSHLNSRRENHRTLATLYFVCKENGMTLPWFGVMYKDDFESQLRDMTEVEQIIDPDVMEIFDVKAKG
jgi:hypothetical protein